MFPVQLLDIIVRLFSDCVSCVKRDRVYSSMFVITSGVRQGSVLSPILFNLYMNDLANINPGNWICIILYADDILLIATSVLDRAIIKKSCCLRIGPRARVFFRIWNMGGGCQPTLGGPFPSPLPPPFLFPSLPYTSRPSLFPFLRSRAPPLPSHFPLPFSSLRSRAP